MATLTQIVNDPRWNKLSPEKQKSWMRENNLSAQDIFVAKEAENPESYKYDSSKYTDQARQQQQEQPTQDQEESSWGGVIGRGLYRGVAGVSRLAGNVVEGDTYRVNPGETSLFGSENVEWVTDDMGNMVAINTKPVEERRKEQQESVKATVGKALQKPIDWVDPAKTSALTGKSVVSGFLENAPTSGIYLGLNMLGPAGAAVSNAVMYQDSFLSRKKELIKAMQEGKIAPMSEGQIDELAAKYGLAEVIPEGGSDAAEAAIIKFFTKGLKVGKIKGAQDFMKFVNKSTLTRAAAATAASMPLEGGSEMITENFQADQDIMLGLDTQANKGTRILQAGLVGSFSGGVTSGAITTYTASKEKNSNQILSEPVQTSEDMSKDDFRNSVNDRLKAGTAFIHLANQKIEADNKEELIANLTNNIYSSILNNESIPMNESIFTSQKDSTNTVNPGRSEDTDILQSSRQAVRDPKQALNMDDVNSNANVEKEVKQKEQIVQEQTDAELRSQRLAHEAQIDPAQKAKLDEAKAWNDISKVSSSTLTVGVGSTVTLIPDQKTKQVKYTLKTPTSKNTYLISAQEALAVRDQAEADRIAHENNQANQQAALFGLKQQQQAKTKQGTTAPTQGIAVSAPVESMPNISQHIVNAANEGTLSSQTIEDYLTKQDKNIINTDLQAMGLPQLTGNEEQDSQIVNQYVSKALDIAKPHLDVIKKQQEGISQPTTTKEIAKAPVEEKQTEPLKTEIDKTTLTKEERAIVENSTLAFEYLNNLINGMSIRASELEIRSTILGPVIDGETTIDNEFKLEGRFKKFEKKTKSAKTSSIDKYIADTYKILAAAIKNEYVKLESNGQISLVKGKETANSLTEWIKNGSFAKDALSDSIGDIVSSLRKTSSTAVSFSIKEGVTDKIVEHMLTGYRTGGYPSISFEDLVELAHKFGEESGAFSKSKKSKDKNNELAAKYASIIREMAERNVFKTVDGKYTLNTNEFDEAEAKAVYDDNYAHTRGSKVKNDDVIERYKNKEAVVKTESKEDTRLEMPEKIQNTVEEVESVIDELAAKEELTDEDNVKLDEAITQLNAISSQYGDVYKMRNNRVLELIKMKAFKLSALRTTDPKAYISNRIRNIALYLKEFMKIKDRLVKENLLPNEGKITKKLVKISEKASTDRIAAMKNFKYFLGEATYTYDQGGVNKSTLRIAEALGLSSKVPKWEKIKERENKKNTIKELQKKTADINRIAKFLQELNKVAYDYFYQPHGALSIAFDNISKDLTEAKASLSDTIIEQFNKEFKTKDRYNEIEESLADKYEDKAELKKAVDDVFNKELLATMKSAYLWGGGNSSTIDWMIIKDFITYVQGMSKPTSLSQTLFKEVLDVPINITEQTTTKQKKEVKNDFVNKNTAEVTYKDVEDYIKKAKIPATVAKVLRANAKDIKVNYSVVPKDWTSKKEVKKSEELYKQRQVDRAEAQQIAEEEAAKIEDARIARIEAGKLAARYKQSDVRWSGIDVNKAEIQIPTEVDQYDQPSEEGNGTVYVTRLLDQNGDQIGEEKTTLKKLEAKKHLTAFENEIRQAEDRLGEAGGTTKPKTVRKQIKKVADTYSYTKDENGIYTATHPASEFTGVGETKAAAKKDLDLQTQQSKEAIAAIEKDVKKAAKKQKKNVGELEEYPAITGTHRIGIRNTLKQHDKNEITSDKAIDKVQSIYDNAEAERKAKLIARLGNDPRRGYWAIINRLSAEVRDGNIDSDIFNVIKWFLDKNPSLADDLAVRVIVSKDNEAKGIYTPFTRIISLFKGHADSKTVIHETLHHLERMMPEEIQSEIRKSWIAAVVEARNDAIKNNYVPERVKLLEDILMQDLSTATITNKFKELYQRGIVSIEDYRLVNPSEYWAVKLTEGVSNRASDSVWTRAVQWLKETIEHIKSVLGLKSDAPLYKTLNDIIKGDGNFKSKKMLAQAKHYSEITAKNVIPKYTSLGKIKGIMEKSAGFKTVLKNNLVTPMIQSIGFQENYEAKMHKYIHVDGMNEKEALDKAIDVATKEDTNGPIARTHFENHRMKTNQADIAYFMATEVVDGKLINRFENADRAHEVLSDKERTTLTDLAYQGTDNQVEYKTLEEAQEAIGKRIGYNKSDVNQKVFDAYLMLRKAANHSFRNKNMLFFNSILDDIVNKTDISADKIDAVKDVLTREIYKKSNAKGGRIEAIKDKLFEVGLSKPQYEAVIDNLYPMIRAARTALRFYVDGGMVGGLSKYRKSKAENPYVVRMYETKTTEDPNDPTKTIEKRQLRYATFFPTQATMEDFVERVKNSDNAVKYLFNGEDINVENFKKENGELDISYGKEVQAVINSEFNTSDSVRLATNSMLDQVINSIKATNENDEDFKKVADKIKRQIIARAALDQIRAVNNKFRKRKGPSIRGYDIVDPMTVIKEDVSQISGFLARKNYIARMTDYALSENGDRRIEATKLIQDSFMKYRDHDKSLVRASASIANAATVSFMTYRVVTTLTQAHQYFVFGMGELVGSGATFKEAISLLSNNYVKLSLVRLGISASDFKTHILGDKMMAKFLRNSLPAGGYKAIVDTLDQLTKVEKAGNIIYTPEELLMLARHRNNNDVSDNMTKELNTMEWSEKEALGYYGKTKDAVGGIARAGMILFNEFEVLNREATLMSMYQFRKKKGDTNLEADVKATNFMLRVNGDFNPINKIEALRRHPILSSVFALTGFAFHALGLLGYRTGQALGFTKNKRTAAQNWKGLIAYGAMGMLLGGAKGEPLWDWLNKMYSMLVGRNVMLEWEQAAKSGDHNLIVQKIIDFAFRGAPAVVGFDWSSNVGLQPPFADSIMSLMGGKDLSLNQSGAGLSWLFSLLKAGRRFSNLEIKRGVEDLNIGGVSQWLKANRYRDEGYTTKSGTPIYIGDKPRKLTDKEAIIYKTGFKTLNMSRQQEVINDQISIGKEWWGNKRKDAINNYFKIVSPYINKGMDIPDAVQEKAMKEILQFNNKLSLASKGTLLSVDPIVSDSLLKAAQNRYTPNKRTVAYESMYSDLINKEHNSLDSEADED